MDEKIKIRILSVILLLLGIVILLFFFPPTQGGFGFATGLFYSIIGFIYIILAIGLFFLFKIARLLTIIISSGYLIFIGIEICKDVISDKTGQSLVGLILISPIILINIISLYYFTRSKVKEWFLNRSRFA